MISCIIPTKDQFGEKCSRLVENIRSQDYDQSKIEIITVEEGDSEQAKAIGIRRAKGDICLMLCDDNLLIKKMNIFKYVENIFSLYPGISGLYSKHYAVMKRDFNSLNRYFALIGANDPIPFYLNKADRLSCINLDKNILLEIIQFPDYVPSLGCNGFFFRKEHILKADLDHYYPMDVAEDLRRKGHFLYARVNIPYLWHITVENNDLIEFLKRRYRYARDLFSDREDRRWRIIDSRKDVWRLFLFIGASIALAPCIWTSVRGFYKVRDWAWFWHWPVCFGFLIMYGLLACRNVLKYQSLSQAFSVQKS